MLLLHPRKVMTTGDGGMITTRSSEHDQSFRLWRHHGMSVSDTVRHELSQVIFETYPVVGYNYRMTDIQAAVGRVQLRRLDEIIKRRRAIAAQYRNLLSSIEGVQFLSSRPGQDRTGRTTASACRSGRISVG